jgi:hypothetical protein
LPFRGKPSRWGGCRRGHRDCAISRARASLRPVTHDSEPRAIRSGCSKLATSKQGCRRWQAERRLAGEGRVARADTEVGPCGSPEAKHPDTKQAPSSLQHALVKRSVDSLSRMRLLLRLRVTPCSAHGLVVQATEYDLLQLANYDAYHTALRVLRFNARSLRPSPRSLCKP